MKQIEPENVSLNFGGRQKLIYHGKALVGQAIGNSFKGILFWVTACQFRAQFKRVNEQSIDVAGVCDAGRLFARARYSTPKVRNINLTVSDGKPMLKGDMVFFNPNKVRMKLKKKIDLAILWMAKSRAGRSKDAHGNSAEGEFTVPIEVELILKNSVCFDTISTILGGKKTNGAHSRKNSRLCARHDVERARGLLRRD